MHSFNFLLRPINIKTKIKTNIQVFADENMITILLRNLISNAIKFTPYQSEIRIKTESLENLVKIPIKDNGVGMSAENIEKLFRTDAKVQTSGTKDEKRTGLDLLICKEFVDKHNAQIWVKSLEAADCESFLTFPNQN